MRAKDDCLMAMADGEVRFRGRKVDIVPADPATPRLTCIAG